MKFLASILAILTLCASAGAAVSSRISAALTLTNFPVTGNTVTINGSARTWTNSFSIDTISTNVTIAGSATNLYRHLTTNGPTGPILVTQTGATNITLLGSVGQAMSISSAGSWLSVSYSTQVVTLATAVRVPMEVEVASNRVTIASELVRGISDNSTNRFATNSTALLHYVTTNTAQTLSNKTLAYPITIGAGQTGGFDLNVTQTNNTTNVFSGINRFGQIIVTNLIAPSNSYFSDPIFTNGINRGRAFQSYSNYSDSVQIGLNAHAFTNDSIAIGEAALATGLNSIAIGTAAEATNASTTAIGVNAQATASSASAFGYTAAASGAASFAVGPNASASMENAFALGYNSTASQTNAFALGYNSESAYRNSLVIGNDASATETNQIRLGNSTHIVSCPGSAAFGNLMVGTASRYTLPADFAGGIILTNGTSASANPANGVVINAASGEWIYRSSATSEGAGQNNRVHNRAAEVVGSGTDYTLTASTAFVDFGGTDPDINTLPSAGTYLITALVTVTAGASANDVYNFKLRNATGAADISNSSQSVNHADASDKFQVVLQSIVTVTGADRIQLYGHNSTAARGTVNSTETKLTYVRLH